MGVVKFEFPEVCGNYELPHNFLRMTATQSIDWISHPDLH